ncbi:uncharacterized protein BJ212DRAFT_452113 [Suillus subaureus]|uniref:G domain-containing protein n=1 Tax=Suillus subaureus TaxID=48587 RepID=A0A9P7E6I3_9AGAM|nr:uncharacterized protein BJ212DRAFT_452113 [Suillus subaureus]KAG1812474.1 hypothetical protein BJ212DRAFT_452113 [Suillus subaureus]
MEVIECITPKNIIIFGERGAGKSSVINLLAGRKVAETSSDQDSLTLHYDAYGTTIDGIPYRVYDTTGFDDYRTNPSGFLYAITNAHKLAKELREKGGVNLLLYCIKGDLIPPTFITNYRLLYELLFEEKVPVALIATHLEREDHMDDWYTRNKGWFERQAVKHVDHACITTADNPDPKCTEKYEMSRTEVGKLISRQAQHWNRGDWSHARAVEADDSSIGQASKADVLRVLMKRCGLGESLAKVVIRNLAPNMVQSSVRTIPPEMAESTIRTIRSEMTESTIQTTPPEIVDSTIQITPPEMVESTIRTIRPEMSESTIQTTPPDIADSTVQAVPPEAVTRTEPDTTFSMPDTPIPEGLQVVKYHSPPKRNKSIVIFGAGAAGKSALVNLMAGENVATTSSDVIVCTQHWEEYPISFAGESYSVFDTMGIDEPQIGIPQYLDAVENAYQLIKMLDEEGGIDLLLFCMRAGRLTATHRSIYRLFNEFLCEKKVPVVLVFTHLEIEPGGMENYWERNRNTFEKYLSPIAGHACITATRGNSPQRYEESRTTIRNVVQRLTADRQRDTLFASLIRKPKELLAGGPLVKRKDLVPLLTKRCGISPDIAKRLADRIRQDVG